MKLNYHLNAMDTRFRAHIRRARLHSILTFWALVDHLFRRLNHVRTLSVRRVAAAVLVALAVAIPSGLYVEERAQRMELARAYKNLTFSSSMEVSTLRQTMGRLMSEQAELRGLLLEAGYSVYSDNHLLVPMVSTGYSSSVIETDDTPYVTASNTMTHTGIVALSRDLLKRYNPEAPFSFGDVIHLSGLGDFIVEDSMNERWHHRVDIWFPNRASAFKFGRRQVILRAPVTIPASKEGPAAETAYRYTLPFNLATTSAGLETANSP